MKFGIAFASSWPFNEPAAARDLAVAGEENGFESLWAVEHVLWPESYESTYPYSRSGRMHGEATTSIPDPLVWLTWVGAQTSRIRLGTGVLLLPLRHPLAMAKAFATLDDFSDGRVEAGIGVGWLREEFEALSVPFDDRGARTDEYVAAMRTAWAEHDASFRGEYVSFEGVNVNPKPVRGSIPVTVGGHTLAAARRAGRIGDGFFPGRAAFGELEDLFAEVARAATQAGRDPADVVLTAAHPQGIFEDTETRLIQLEEMGVSRVVVPAFLLARPDLETGMARAAEIVAEFGGDSAAAS